MLTQSSAVMLTLILFLSGCQREKPAQPTTSGAAAPAGSDQNEAPPGAADSQPVDVQVTKPTRRELIYTVTLPANISPLYQTTLYAKVSGYLKWIGPDKGDAVKKDQVLAIIDAPEVEEQYHQALSDYHIKKLTFERLIKVWKESPDVIASRMSMLQEPPLREPNIWWSSGSRFETIPRSARPTPESSRPVLPIPAR
jgi:biotin carboxyl carrier protein